MAQAECITTAIREPMSRGLLPRSTSPVQAAHIELVGAIAGNPPHTISIDANPVDIEARGDHLEKVLAAIRVYLTAILADTAENIPGGFLDCKYLDDLYTELTDEAVGGIRKAAEEMAVNEPWRAS